MSNNLEKSLKKTLNKLCDRREAIMIEIELKKGQLAELESEFDNILDREIQIAEFLLG